MSDVFITYAPADRSRVQGLSKALKRRGWRIGAPMELATDTKNRFGPSAKAMLVLCSPYAVNNPSVLGQIRRARARNIPIVPIVTDRHAELPAALDDESKALRFDWDPPRIYQKLDTFLRSGKNSHEAESTTQAQTGARHVVRSSGNGSESTTLDSTSRAIDMVRSSFPRSTDGLSSIIGNKRFIALFSVLALAAAMAAIAWLASSGIESPADAAARTAAPKPSPILVPVEKRVLSSNVVTRGTARFGLPQPISIAPSALKANAGLITTLPARNTQIEEGDVILSASGRPVFVLQGRIPAYRDLVPGITGNDVRQLEEGLKRLGSDPGPIDGTYDRQTSAAVAEWYKSTGWEPMGPTRDQRAQIRTLERELAEARKIKLTASRSAAATALAVESARATARHSNRVATDELAARTADRSRLVSSGGNGTSLAVESERAKAEHARAAAESEVAARIADRALIVLDPRQTATARAEAEAKLKLARAAAEKIRLESEMAIQAAERDLGLTAERFELAITAVERVKLESRLAIQAALDAQVVANLDARLATDRFNRLSADMDIAKRKLGTQVPVDEIIFIPELPVRVKEVTALVGDPARGPVMSVTDNQLAIDSSLPLDSAPLVKPGMPVRIDEQALGIKTTGVVERVANTPGTRGVDGYHIYFEVRVNETTTPLAGFSLRLTIPIESTEGAVTAVPMSALSLAADGKSRIQVETDGALQYMVVEPGLSAGGYVKVTPVDGDLTQGRLVVVGYENPENRVIQ